MGPRASGAARADVAMGVAARVVRAGPERNHLVALVAVEAEVTRAVMAVETRATAVETAAAVAVERVGVATRRRRMRCQASRT